MIESKKANPEDLEDGEIEDGEIEDDDEVVQEQLPSVENTVAPIVQPKQDEIKPEKIDRDKPRDRERRDKRHKEKDTRHMTEAEKSILHLRRKERMEREREKWVRRKEHQTIEPQDDFAIKLEKTLASILKKDRVTSDEDKEEERRGSKRKRKDKDGEHNAKHHKLNTPPMEKMDETEMLNIRGGSPEPPRQDKDDRPKSPRSEGSYDSEYSSDQVKLEEKANRGRRESRRESKKNNKNKNKNRERNFKKEKSRESKPEPTTDSKGICIFYLNGKCNKNDCIYSHEAVPPMKLELCKFYLMDCCAKGDNCSYMHSDFPCKFYHMGLPCNMGDQCKFSHGEPLSDGLKQILFKHIETAPRDILGGFPRLSREETLQMMDNTQKNLMDMYKEQKQTEQQEEKVNEGTDEGPIPSLFDISIPVPAELKEEPGDSKSKSSEKAGRKNKPSRWQAAEPKEKVSNIPMNFGPFNFSQDQDMRINSNGDIDMRTLPPHPQSSLPQPLPSSLLSSDLSRVNPLRNSSGDVDIRNITPNFASDVDIRLQSTFEVPTRSPPEQSSPFSCPKDVDIRQLGPPPSHFKKEEGNNAVNQNKTSDSDCSMNILSNLPKMQRELYLRIQSQQRENPPTLNMDYEDSREDDLNNDEDWYSDDDDEHRLTIKVDNEDVEATEHKEEKTETVEFPGLPAINPIAVKPQEVVDKLGDLSKINITADITKLLSSLSSLPIVPPPAAKIPDTPTSRDPRQAKSQGVTINSPSRSPTSSGNDSSAPLAPKTLFDPRLGQEQKVNQASEAPIRDPRKGGAVVTASRLEKMSIYEQGGLNMDDTESSEEYKASSRPDVDLRTLGLPFKGMESYTPATEIDASYSTHLPITWKVVEVEIPRPDYSGLKLSLEEAEKTGDPRLRKIFRLSVEERDTPLSPKASPQRPTTVRIDPRLRKAEEAKTLTSTPDTMNYTQQLNTLQSSAFYQSLTSNQKVMLNQELASRSDQTGSHDPILNSLLTTLNLLPGITGGASTIQGHGANFGVAANILQSINKMTAMSLAPNMNPNMINPNNPMMASMVQPGLLGAAPGIPNMPQQDFPMNFDPRNPNGLLGNGPPQQFSNFEPPSSQGGFQNYPNDDFYPQDNQGGFRGGNQGRNDRGGNNFNNRERRRGGRNNFGRSQGNRNQFRRNQAGGGRSNKGHNQS